MHSPYNRVWYHATGWHVNQGFGIHAHVLVTSSPHPTHGPHINIIGGSRYPVRVFGPCIVLRKKKIKQRTPLRAPLKPNADGMWTHPYDVDVWVGMMCVDKTWGGFAVPSPESITPSHPALRAPHPSPGPLRLPVSADSSPQPDPSTVESPSSDPVSD